MAAPVSTSVPEPKLVGAAQSGSVEAFTELVRRHRGPVRAYVARFLSAREAVDDLTQEIFLAAHAGLTGFRGQVSFRLWALAIARNIIADHLKAELRRRSHSASALERAVIEWQIERAEADEPLLPEHERRLAALSDCLERLPRENADIVKRHYFRAQSTVELAQRLRKREGAVRMALLRIRGALRDCIQQRLAQEGGGP